jgi:hypothetical protein
MSMSINIYSTVNASLKSPISEDELADIIKSGNLPDEYFSHLCVFFY